MGGKGSGRLNKTDAFMRDAVQRQSPITKDSGGEPIFLPNHSGKHERFIAGPGATIYTDISNPLFLGLPKPNITKYSYIVSNQYDSDSEPEGFLMMGGVSNNAVNNNLFIGGGSSSHNVASNIDFYTFSDTTTRTGNRAMTIASDQNVGIGTNAPANKLHVKTGTDENLRIRQGSDLSGANGIMIQSINDADSSLRDLVLRANSVLMSGGNVGIGTTSPSRNLHVHSTGQTDMHLTTTNSGTASTDGLTLSIDASLDAALINREVGKIRFYTSGDEHMVLHDTGGLALGDDTYVVADPGAGGMIIEGNVGIGTTSPVAKLTIVPEDGNDDNAIHITNHLDSSQRVQLGVDSNFGVVRLQDNTGNDKINIIASGNTYFNGGNVGIGTNSPVTKTEIADGTSAVLTLHNTEHTDVEGDRLGGISFRGEQSGGEIHVLSKVEVVHDGGADDQKGRLDWYVNDGDDGTTPSLRFSQIFSDGKHIHKDSTGDTVTFFDGTYGLNVDTSGGEGASARFYDNNSTVIICDGGNEALEAGGATDKIFVDNDGSIFWGGSGNGLHFCSCYGNEIGWTQVAAQNTWYDISDADITTGQSNVISHSQGQFTVSKNGMYEVHYDISVQSSVANKHIQATFSVNGTEGNDGMNHIEAPSANKSFAVGGCAILALSANDTVNCSIRTTDAGNPTLEVDHYNITIKLIGGNDPAP